MATFTAFLVLSLAFMAIANPTASAPVPKQIAQQRLDAVQAGCTQTSPFSEPGSGFPKTPKDKEFCDQLIHFWFQSGYQVINGYVFGARSNLDLLGGTLKDFLENRGLVQELKFGGIISPTEEEVQYKITAKQNLGTCPHIFINADMETLQEHIHDKTKHPEFKPKLDKIFGAPPSYMTQCMKHMSDTTRKNTKQDVLYRGASVRGFGADTSIGVGAKWESMRYTSTTWQPFLTNFINANMIVMCGLRGQGMVITDRGEDEVMFAPGQLSCTVEQKLTDKAVIRAHPLISVLPGKGANAKDMDKIQMLWFMNCGQPCSTYFNVDGSSVPTTLKTVAEETQISQGLMLEVPNYAIFAVGMGAGGLLVATIQFLKALSTPKLLDYSLLEEI